MKGLWKYISPFAPDHSGATAVFYDLGGIIVICDAGGCAGNVCGFDEPRWFTKKSAIFSAGLRDMDAILGRDEKLVEKLKDTANKVNAKFAVIIGTPVPAVIATDYRALEMMAENTLKFPVMTVNTDGMEMYDIGASKAYMALFKKFTKEKLPKVSGKIGILGATHFDLNLNDGVKLITNKLKLEGASEICFYGIGDSLENIKNASSFEKNIVISPSGIESAKWLKKHFDIPFTLDFPAIPANFQDKYVEMYNKKILILNQVIAAQELANEISKFTKNSAELQIGTWFTRKDLMYRESIRNSENNYKILRLTEEDDFINLVYNEKFDIIIGDKVLKKAIPNYNGQFIDWSHFAISGKVG